MAADGGVSVDIGDVCLAPFGGVARGKVGPPPRPRNATASLERIVEGEIGPRLVLLHHEPSAISPPQGRPTPEDIKRLAMLVIGTDEQAIGAHFEKVCAQQHSYSTLLAYFVAPAAHLLGEFWKQDVCDFFEVTIGMGRLQAFMDRLAAPEPLSAADVRRRALLIALPGETHLLSLIHI